MNDKREIFGWSMYDWANSAFSTTVATLFMGPYLLSLGKEAGGVNILGFIVEPGAFFSACIFISVLLQVFLLPLLGAIADYSRLKKSMMMLFAYTGASLTTFLFFIQGDLVLLGGILFIFANLCFGAAIVFYNAFLPEIASPDQRDRVSSLGWGIGYLGGGILLLLNLILVSVMDDKGLAVRISLASAGVWWLTFTFLFPQRRLRQREPARQLPPGENYLSQGVKQLLSTLRGLASRHPQTLLYLIAFLIYNDGIQMVIVQSSSFAKDEFNTADNTLALLVLMVQFVALGGAFLFGYLAQKIGAKKSIMISLVVWSGIVIFAYALLKQEWQLWILGATAGIVLGGSQALSRSLFSQMIPAGQESEYFGMYEISERGSSLLGAAFFAVAIQLTGTFRVAILSLIIFFIIGLALLSRVNVRKAMRDAGHDPEGLVL